MDVPPTDSDLKSSMKFQTWRTTDHVAQLVCCNHSKNNPAQTLHTLMWSGVRPLRSEFRLGLQCAICAWALLKSRALRAKSSMCGVSVSSCPYAPSWGRKSSTAMNSTFGAPGGGGCGGG
eukprot:COSAG01_NODE_1988_length_8706_cov_16.749506_5_plen_120_part_00